MDASHHKLLLAGVYSIMGIIMQGWETANKNEEHSLKEKSRHRASSSIWGSNVDISVARDRDLMQVFSGHGGYYEDPRPGMVKVIRNLHRSGDPLFTPPLSSLMTSLPHRQVCSILLSLLTCFTESFCFLITMVCL